MPEIKASQFAAALGKRLQADTETIRKAAVEVCAWGEQNAVRLTNEADAVDQGQFKNAWTHQALHNGAELRNDSPYAAVIEHGRRPGRPGPPLAPILAWVNRKLVKNGDVEEGEAFIVAKSIRWAIHVRGTKPRKILGRTFKAMGPRFKREVRRRLAIKG